jgi:hypothetical protein
MCGLKRCGLLLPSHGPRLFVPCAPQKGLAAVLGALLCSALRRASGACRCRRAKSACVLKCVLAGARFCFRGSRSPHAPVCGQPLAYAVSLVCYGCLFELPSVLLRLLLGGHVRKPGHQLMARLGAVFAKKKRAWRWSSCRPCALGLGLHGRGGHHTPGEYLRVDGGRGVSFLHCLSSAALGPLGPAHHKVPSGGVPAANNATNAVDFTLISGLP